jgi:hypothetical protein
MWKLHGRGTPHRRTTHIQLWLPIKPAGLDPRSGHMGFVVMKVESGQIISEHFGFPFPTFTPPRDQRSDAILGWYNAPSSGRRTKWTQFQSTPRQE